MRGCRPLNQREQAQALAVLRGKRTALRNRCLFLLGLNTGFRISELLSLRVGDVLHHGHVVERVRVARRNMKGKRESRDVVLNVEARQALALWLPELLRWRGGAPDLFLFQSQKGSGITRQQACRIVTGLAGQLGWDGQTGTHSLRKTFAHAVYGWAMDNWNPRSGQENPIRVAMHALGHSSVSSTEHYLGLDTAKVDQAVLSIGQRGRAHAHL
jgi:integrase